MMALSNRRQIIGVSSLVLALLVMVGLLYFNSTHFA